MIVKTLEEIIEDINNKFNYYPTPFGKVINLEVAKEIRRLTLEECDSVAEVTIVDSDYLRNTIWGVDSGSILNLDLEKIQTW